LKVAKKRFPKKGMKKFN